MNNLTWSVNRATGSYSSITGRWVISEENGLWVLRDVKTHIEYKESTLEACKNVAESIYSREVEAERLSKYKNTSLSQVFVPVKSNVILGSGNSVIRAASVSNMNNETPLLSNEGVKPLVFNTEPEEKKSVKKVPAKKTTTKKVTGTEVPKKTATKKTTTTKKPTTKTTAKKAEADDINKKTTTKKVVKKVVKKETETTAKKTTTKKPATKTTTKKTKEVKKDE